MEISLARQIVATIPPDKLPILAEAYERYMYFAGVYAADTIEELSRVNEDRARFSHLLKFAGHCPTISNERCAEFMAMKTGMPREWCLAWDEVNFIAIHGEDIYTQQDRSVDSAQSTA